MNSYLKKLKHHLDYKFSGDPAIQVLDFLTTFKEAADLNGISEGIEVLILPYFIDGLAKSGLSSRFKQAVASLPKFPVAVQWLLQSFATEAVIAAACQKVFSAKQLPDEDEKTFANRLTRHAAEAGSVFTEDALISTFVDGLLPYAGNMVRGQVTPNMTFAEVQIHAEQVGAAGRAITSPVRYSPRLMPPGVHPVRPKLGIAAMAESAASSPHEELIRRSDLQRHPLWSLPLSVLSHMSRVRNCPQEVRIRLSRPVDGRVPLDQSKMKRLLRCMSVT